MTDLQQGMNVEAVRDSAGALTRHAATLGELRDRADKAVALLAAHWEGEDFVELQASWTGTSRAALEECREAILQLSKTADEQADAQDEVSGEGGGAGAGGAAGGGGAGPGSGRGAATDPALRDRVDPSTGVDRPADPYAEGNERTPGPGGSTIITDADGNRWVEDSQGRVFPAGTVLDEDGGIHRGFGDHGDGPGSLDRGAHMYADTEGRDKAVGGTAFAERTWDNAYTRWKADPDSAWNDPLREGAGDRIDRAESFLDDHDVDVDVTVEPLAETSAEGHKSVSALSRQWGDGDNGIRAEVLSASVEGEAHAAIGPAGAVAGVSAAAGVYAGKVDGRFQTGEFAGMSAKGEGRAYAGAEAKAGGEASIGPGGIKAGVSAEAFAGAKAEGSVSGSLGPAEVGVGGEISYGIGAHAEVDGEISMDHVGVSLDIGATLGVGTGVKLDVSVNPKDLVSKLPHLF